MHYRCTVHASSKIFPVHAADLRPAGRLAIIAPILEPLSLSGHTCADCANLGNNVYDEYTYMIYG
jgi:hypothetical protein